MWHGLLHWMEKEMLPHKLINPDDLHIAKAVDSIEAAVQIIKASKEKFDQETQSLETAGSKRLGVQ